MSKKSIFLLLFSLVAMTSCSRKFYHARTFEKRVHASKNLQNSFHGVCFYDIDAQKYVLQYNHDKYFTPASNTKLLTFYAGLRLLPQRSPALRYVIKKDSLIFWGTADGSLFYPPTANDSTAIQFLRSRKEKLFFSSSNFTETIYGDGWAADDFLYDYSPERSPLPVYGNIATIVVNNNKATISPKIFEKNLQNNPTIAENATRDFETNLFFYKSIKGRSTAKVPFKTSDELTAQLLSDTLNREVKLINYRYNASQAKVIESIAMDTIYKKMLQLSDNFLAEHLLLACSGGLPDQNYALNEKKTIDYLMQNDFASFLDKPKWVDGSGLSRYNLFTPRMMVQLLLKIHAEFAKNSNEEKRLFSLLPTPGGDGTLQNMKKIYPPTLYAKTGTLSNNHNLSGYLITKSGKRLCFSLMNNHFLVTNATIRTEMAKILMDFYEKY